MTENPEQILKEKGFESLNQQFNLRNSKEISEYSKQIAEQDEFRYQNGIVLPPANFPRGRPPVHIKTIDEALKSALKTSSTGILFVVDGFENNFKDQLILPSVLKYGCKIRIFDDEIKSTNPCLFLKERGNILISHSANLGGFEFPSIIYFYHPDNLSYQTVPFNLFVEEHRCNLFLRCTSQMIIVDDKTSKKYEFTDIKTTVNSIYSTNEPETIIENFENFHPLDSISELVEIPEDLKQGEYNWNSKKILDWFKNGESLLPHETKNVFKTMEHTFHGFKLLLPTLQTENETDDVRIIRKFFGPKGCYELIRWVNSRGRHSR